MKSKLAVGLLTAAVSSFAFAAPITSIDNVRPITPSAAPAGEVTLAAALNFLFPAGSVQQSTGVFESATGSMTSVPTVILEQTGGASDQRFGIWFGNNTSSIVSYEIFNGAAVGGGACNGVGCGAGTGTFAAISIVGNTLTVVGLNGANTGTFTNAAVSQGYFGFYFQSGNTIAYTLDLLNAGGTARVLAYEGTGARQSNWAFAYEDGSDFDYNDMVVKVESITRVPVPGSLALMGLGLVGLAALRRKQA